MSRHASSTETSSKAEHAPLVQDRDPTPKTSAGRPARDNDTKTKIDNFMKRVSGETSELQRLLEMLLETRGSTDVLSDDPQEWSYNEIKGFNSLSAESEQRILISSASFSHIRMTFVVESLEDYKFASAHSGNR